MTPSHHRVHHGSDAHYLDKNYGSTFIIWDRIFGTFKAEEGRPTYGITKPVTSYNPVYLVFHEWADIVSDIKKARDGKEVYQILFGKPGDEVIKNRELREQSETETTKLKSNVASSPTPILVSNENSLLKKED
ncbi:sterol desaturase family protein [Cyclobacterium qasimii M12-11B]|uniref:Sterol desaturase family protein n=1 Tax=Cyclobacterium qasimii M12-11B TaxID=641524 RepID=S7X304_9BACT|nr:sterol desaturase family protein [Cyclobacterium qasimii M12-11B]